MRTRTEDVPESNPASAASEWLERDVLTRGTQVGPWRVEERLGVGGMGQVYAVVHRDIGKQAAMKVLHRRVVDTLDAERITFEGQVVNRVAHPNIVDIFDSGTVDGCPYLVMERLQGATLALAAGGGLAPDHAVEILIQLCDALSSAHAAGVIHRDLKPDNIFLVTGGSSWPHVKLLDWGIAKVCGDARRLTMKGQVIGTPEYLAPEQACGRPVTTSTDIYSLGVVAYELFARERPFVAASVTEMLMQHCTEAPPPLRGCRPELPEALERLLMTMLAKDPVERPTIAVVHEQLMRLRPQMEGSCLLGRALALADGSPCASNRYVPISRRLLSRCFTVQALAIAMAACVAVALMRAEHASGKQRMSVVASTLPPVAPVHHVSPVVVVPHVVPHVNNALSPAQPSRVAPRPVSRHQAERHTPVSVPTRAIATIPSESDAPSGGTLIDRYTSIGRELAVRSGQIKVDDLWSRYRRIRIYDTLSAADARRQTGLALSEIETELARRVGLIDAR